MSGRLLARPTAAAPADAGVPPSLGRTCLLLGALYLAAALLSLFLSRQPGSIASIWYANAVAIAVFARRPPSQWPALALVLVLVNPLANVLWGDDFAAGLAFLPANLLEIVLAAAALRRWGALDAPSLSASVVMRWLVLGGVLPQLAGACAGAIALASGDLASFGSLWLQWFEGAVVGALSLLALMLMALRGPFERFLQDLRDARVLVLALLTVGVTLVATGSLPYPFVYVVLPLLLSAVLLEFTAVAALTALASFTMAAALGLGVLVPPPTTSQWQEVFVYLAFACALVPAQLLAAVTSDLRDSQARLVQRTRELSAAREAAEAADRAKGAFLAAISHEIRTPMNGVLGTADVLARSPLTERQATEVEAIRRSALALLGLIDEILDFSKIEAGRMSLERLPMSLSEVVQEARQTLVPIALERAVTLETRVEPDLPDRVWGDPLRLRQILINLGANAIKFSAGRPGRPGRVLLTLAVDAAGLPPRLLIRVEDNGIGMSPQAVHGLFRAFAQGEASTARRFGGSGLGLAIVKSLVDLMEGTIDVSSTEGEGTCFVVRLPLSPWRSLATGESVRGDLGPPERTAVAAHEAASALPAASGWQPPLLVAEDDPVNRLVIVRQLQVLGHVADVVSDGAEALRCWRPGRYALLLTDLNMPDLDGVALAESIRRLEAQAAVPAAQRLPIVALTANAVREDQLRARAAGIDDVLTKPVLLDALQDVLERWLPAPFGTAADPARDVPAPGAAPRRD